MNSSTKKKLTILDSSGLPLRGDSSPFIGERVWPQQHDTPRALRSLAQIVDGGLCHRCGSCVGICPTAVLSCDGEEYPTVTNLSACTDCDLCVKVCPGDDFNYPAETEKMFAAPPLTDSTHGHFLSGALAYATDPIIREHSTSGGLVTALLVGMLRCGEIDGAVTIVGDEGHLWKGKPIIARSEEELLASMKSKYAITATNSVFSEIIATPGRYAIVGLPCQIHGFRKAAALNKTLAERVTLTIALFCHAAIEHQAFNVIWDTLPDRIKDNAKKFISRVGKHPGTPHVELHDGSMYPVYFGEAKGYRPESIEMINILYRLYTPARCFTCFDALGEFADIAVGDPWMPPPEDNIDFYKGWSFALIRTPRGAEIMKKLEQDKELHVFETSTADSLVCNRGMSSEKRARAFHLIDRALKKGDLVPEYSYTVPKVTGWHKVAVWMELFTHLFCFFPAKRDAFLKIILSRWGYILLFFNSLRRKLRVWRRDRKARKNRAARI